MWGRVSSTAAEENIESAIVRRRPKRSASQPPMSEAKSPPSPYTLTARPAIPGDQPIRVSQRTRKTRTNVPSRLTSVSA